MWRVRARVSRLTGNQTFRIRGTTSVAGVRGTDFGFDQVLEPSGAALLNRVYCFEGEVEVVSAESSTGPDQQEVATVPVRVAAGEMVSITRAAIQERRQLEPIAVVAAVQQFWNSHDFEGREVDVDRLEERFPGIGERVASRLGEVPEFVERPRITDRIMSDDEPQTDYAIVDQTDTVDVTPSDVATADVVGADVPGVESGDLPAEPEEVADDTPRVEVTAIDRTAPAPAEAVAEAPVVEAQRERAGFSGIARVTGITFTALGFLAESASIAHYYLGDRLPDGLLSDFGTQYGWHVILGGAASIGVGAVMLAISLMTAN